ncbi:MAG: hypothetical protein EHM90_04930, partial [Chloroflexi bacterium]
MGPIPDCEARCADRRSPVRPARRSRGRSRPARAAADRPLGQAARAAALLTTDPGRRGSDPRCPRPSPPAPCASCAGSPRGGDGDCRGAATIALPVTTIRFGTDGWRAAIAEEFTFHNVRRCARAVADYLAEQGTADRAVVVAHDRRFASEHFARTCVEVLAAHGIRSLTPPGAVPTQVVSFFTRELGAGAGIVITASHNPWTDNGFKVKADTGGAADPTMLSAIEATMDRYPEDELPPRRDYDDAVAAGLVETFDPYPRFRDQLAAIVDLERIRAANGKVLVEPMWGSGAGWFSRLLEGGSLTIRELHTERNPFFGGVNPEPIRPNIDEWLDEIPRWGADIGIAFDGDADRVGMATEEGVFVNQLQVYGLLYWYLLEVRGEIGPAV